MSESFEGRNESGSSIRTAIMAIFLSLAPASARADLPECHDIGSNPAPAKSVRLNDGEEASVICVVDGDTFDVRLKDGRALRIRIWGVDCPESRENKKCMKNGASACQSEIRKGQKAKELTKRLLAGKKVVLEGPFSNNGERKLSYVRVKDQDLGGTLIGSCQCREDYSHKRKSEYRKKAKSCRE